MKFFILLILTNVFANPDIDKIIGTNELVTVNAEATNVPFKYKKIINAFGKIKLPIDEKIKDKAGVPVQFNCTATHLGNGYVITAGHCFEATPALKKNIDCPQITIEWGLRENKSPYLISTCDKIVVQQHDKLNDFAIIQVSPIPPVVIAPEMKRRAIMGDTLTVFSYPIRFPLMWSGPCGVERIQDADLLTEQLQHECDTEFGSSGAALIDVLSLKVVGVHNGGILNYEDITKGMNFGTYIISSPLYESLLQLGFK